MATSTSFDMPVKDWSGLYASEYIVRCYQLSFAPTKALVDALNNSRNSLPQGLRFGEYDTEGYSMPYSVLVYVTDAEYFQKYAEPLLAQAEEAVAEYQKREKVKSWVNTGDNDGNNLVDISGLGKAEVLAALYNGTHPQGLGILSFDPKDMTRDEALSLLDSGKTYFDYLKGRVMKVDLSGDSFDPWEYDRDNYQGAAQDVVNQLRGKNERQ